MALNTTFVSGAILTAAQMNNLPMGIVSVTSAAATSANVSVETLMITAPSFTAVANRYYRITYSQPVFQYVSGTVNQIAMNIKLTSTAGTLQMSSEVRVASGGNATGICTVVKTFSAGATVLIASFTPQGGGLANAFTGTGYAAQLIIEDMGST
jgi:hypothetical protein